MASPPESLADRLEEFDANIWNHTADAFQQQFDTATDIPDEIVEALTELIGVIASGGDEEDLAEAIDDAQGDLGEDFFAKLMQLVGLTRDKLKTDVKALGIDAGLDETAPSSWKVLPRKRLHWPLALRELARRFLAVFGPAADVPKEDWEGIVETVNRATWPGWIRQERAKRSGHQAEARLARICREVGVPFAPAEKAEQDIAPDVEIAGNSFDLVFPDDSKPGACVISTVHSANIGQYGESKDARDIAAAKEALANLNPPPTLIALADGLGFHSNRAGLEGVLTTADEFCQFRTIWKAVVVGADCAGVTLGLWLPDPKAFGGFLGRYSGAVKLLKKRPDDEVEAGDGFFDGS